MEEQHTECREITREYTAAVWPKTLPEWEHEIGMTTAEFLALPDGQFEALAREYPLEVFFAFWQFYGPASEEWLFFNRVPIDVKSRVFGWVYGFDPEPFLALAEKDQRRAICARIGPALDAIDALSPEQRSEFNRRLFDTHDGNAAFFEVTGRQLCPVH